MTKQEKKERRELVHRLQRESVKHVDRSARLGMTVRQLSAAGKCLAQQIMSGANPHVVQTISEKV